MNSPVIQAAELRMHLPPEPLTLEPKYLLKKMNIEHRTFNIEC
jgi:hypothetical protein